MRTIYIRGGGEVNQAITVLTHHLEGRGHKVVRSKIEPYDVCLGWGMSQQEVHGPMLNAHVNQFDKYQAIVEMAKKGISTPVVFTPDKILLNAKFPLPWLARNFVHKGGRDIRVMKTLAQAHRVEADFFSVWIPTATEYRVWIFMGRAFAIYEKVYQGEGEYEGYRRNHKYGFSFEKKDDLRKTVKLTGPAIDAVASLTMDFGAVDVLLGKDGKYYVLEVNSMPNIDDEKRSSGIRLAKRISEWAEA